MRQIKGSLVDLHVPRHFQNEEVVLHTIHSFHVTGEHEYRDLETNRRAYEATRKKTTSCYRCYGYLFADGDEFESRVGGQRGRTGVAALANRHPKDQSTTRLQQTSRQL